MLRRFLILALALSGAPTFATADASSVAAALQSWRDACSDPNPDLAVGYLSDAMATGNIDVRKACLRQVLSSDNVDVQSAALRVLVTSLPMVRFRTGTPNNGNAGGRAREISGALRHGLVFYVSNGDASTGSAQWSPLVMNTAPIETATGRVNVFGSSIQWAGKCYYNEDLLIDCQLSADLTENGQLTGIFSIWDLEYPVSASLYD